MERNLNKLRLLWISCGDGVRWNNFGDEHSATVVRRVSGREIEHIEAEKSDDAELCACGSILHLVNDSWGGWIWGSGIIQDDHQFEFPNAQIKAVRGKLTAKRLGIKKDIALGDPLLLWQGIRRPRYRLGLVPHYVDFPNYEMWKIAKKYEDVLIIDPLARDAPERIAVCAHILSSGLHGLVISDALGIPNQWMTFSESKVVGHGFKFRDYYSAFGIEDPIPYMFEKDVTPTYLIHRIDWSPRPLRSIQEGLLDSFPRELMADPLPSWEERNRIIGNMIEAHSSVLDLGAGSQVLRHYLPEGCEYQPCDLVKTSAETIECDFNAGIYPVLSKTYDYVVISGLLEYLVSPTLVLERALQYGRRVIVSYAQKMPEQTIDERRQANWLSHMTRNEFESVLQLLNVPWELKTVWNEQLVYQLR